MGKVYGCIGRKANKPFFLEKVCCNVYSAEELIYCIYENAELLEKDIFTMELANWLEYECDVKKIAEAMQELIRQNADLQEFARLLLSAFPFVSPGQKERFLELLQDENGGKGPEKKKLRGDYFLHKERFVYALNEYESALALLDEKDTGLMAEIYHNMGMARAGLFLLEQAQADFLKAYELDAKEEHYYYYAAAMRFRMSEGEYIRTISEDVQMREVTLKLESYMQAANEKWQEGPEADFMKEKEKKQAEGSHQYEEWMDNMVSGLKVDYRRYIQ